MKKVNLVNMRQINNNDKMEKRMRKIEQLLIEIASKAFTT